ncbi:MAG: hypothetical protein SNJ57_01215 [Cyanobacteriota bacterium]
MKKLILTAIKCDGLANGETKKLTPKFRGRLMGKPVNTERRWKQWGKPAGIPNPPPSGDIPSLDFIDRIYLVSPITNETLFISRETISSEDSGAKQTLFDPFNHSTADVNIRPRLKYTIQ